MKTGQSATRVLEHVCQEGVTLLVDGVPLVRAAYAKGGHRGETSFLTSLYPLMGRIHVCISCSCSRGTVAQALSICPTCPIPLPLPLPETPCAFHLCACPQPVVWRR